jgi:neutral ceramidase
MTIKRLFAITFLISLLISAYSGNAQKTKANVAKVNITPPLEMKYSLGGYGDRMSNPATGIHDYIYAKAVVLNKEDKMFALVTLDLLGLPPNVKPAVIQKLADKNWTEENIMLLPSHSHASIDMTALNDKNNLGSPQIGIYQAELLDFVVEKIAESINDADKNLKSVKIGTENRILNAMNRNRRNDPDVDRELTVTRIDLENGKPMAVLVNWSAHPTFMDEKDMWVSAGWPGYLQRELESWIGDGAVAMYYNGAQADLSANRPQGGSHYEQAEMYGRELAKSAFEVYSKIEVKDKVELNYSLKEIQLPERTAHPSFMETGGAEYGMSEEMVKVVMEMMCPAQTQVGAVQIGDLVIAGAPGELAAGLGIQVKDQLKKEGVKYPVIGGLANEWISYILSPEQYNGDGGYEASVSFYGETLGSVIVKEMIETAEKTIE